MNGAELIIYDGSSVASSDLWTCVSCSALLPPPFRANSGTALVIIRPPTDGASSYVELQYLGISSSLTGFHETYFLMPIGEIFAPATGNSVLDSYGVIPRSLDYRWIIQPEDTGEEDGVTLMITELELDAEEGDVLTIYDGISDTDDVLVTFSGSGLILNEWVSATPCKAEERNHGTC